MDNVEAPPMSTTSGNSFFTPLLISMIGIVSSSMIIVIYHLIVTSYCRRRQQQEEATAEPRWVPERKLLTGVEEKVLETIPIISYLDKFFLDDQSECAVCIGEFEDGEMVRVLPSCKHAFHVLCIDQWFIGHANCPVCRSPIVAISTKSSPVVIPATPCADHDRTIVDDDGPVNMQSCALLRHCVSLVLPRDRKPRPIVMELKRSLSMDQTSIIIDIERDCGSDSSSSSSSSSSLKNDLTRSKSIKHFDHVPMKLWRPFSRLSLGQQSNTRILPY